MKKKIGTVSFRKNFWVEWDLNPGPNDSDAGSLWTELYKLVQISLNPEFFFRRDTVPIFFFIKTIV